MYEDWQVLLSLFPRDWIEMAINSGVHKSLRKDKDIENYLRTLLIHVGCGYSMRETVVRAKLAGLADISDVALYGRLKKAKDWLRSLCIAMLEESGIATDLGSTFSARLFDATIVKEPGDTGSQWRIHYSVKIPSLSCDFLKISMAKGQGTGESFRQYPIKKGDHIIADRAYSRAAGIHYAASKGGYVIVRVNTGSLVIHDEAGAPFDLLKNVKTIKRPMSINSWKVEIPKRNAKAVQGRICVIRKSNEAIRTAHDKLKRQASKKGHRIKPETLEYAKYVIVFTNCPELSLTASEVLNWYRIRWQVELVFKRFKSISGLGHLPKQSDDSSKAWLYGKLFVALLTEKVIRYAESFSPWGYELLGERGSEFLA